MLLWSPGSGCLKQGMLYYNAGPTPALTQVNYCFQPEHCNFKKAKGQLEKESEEERSEVCKS